MNDVLCYHLTRFAPQEIARLLPLLGLHEIRPNPMCGPAAICGITPMCGLAAMGGTAGGPENALASMCGPAAMGGPAVALRVRLLL